jgi:hypothetical protein
MIRFRDDAAARSLDRARLKAIGASAHADNRRGDVAELPSKPKRCRAAACITRRRRIVVRQRSAP